MVNCDQIAYHTRGKLHARSNWIFQAAVDNAARWRATFGAAHTGAGAGEAARVTASEGNVESGLPKVRMGVGRKWMSRTFACICVHHCLHDLMAPAVAAVDVPAVRRAAEGRQCDAHQFQPGAQVALAESGGAWLCCEDVTAAFMYLRLHGARELYASGVTCRPDDYLPTVPMGTRAAGGATTASDARLMGAKRSGTRIAPSNVWPLQESEPPSRSAFRLQFRFPGHRPFP